MTAKELVARLLDIEKNYKTVYAYGVFGAPISEKIITAKAKQYPSWYTSSRQNMLRGLIGKGYFGFDCVNLIKGVLWGWNGDLNKTYGGAVYNSNGVPDVSADGMISRCKDVSTNFNNLQIGEALWLPGHIGVYIGDGLAIECTPKWQNKVQITAVGNLGKKPGYNTRTWQKRGKMPYVEYGQGGGNDLRYGQTLKRGAKGDKVKRLQEDLIKLGYKKYLDPYGADGSFGGATEKAVRAFQADHKLAVDGSVGPATQAKIEELLKAPATDYKKLYEDTKKQLDVANKKLADIKKIIG
jgi:hypothetical protein